MEKYSRVYKHNYGGKNILFRYNYESNSLENIYKPSSDDVEFEKEQARTLSLDWLREDARKNIESFEKTGYFVVSSEPLSKKSWKEDKEYYMDIMSENTRYVVQAELAEFC